MLGERPGLTFWLVRDKGIMPEEIPKIVFIEWLDSYSITGWQSFDECSSSILMPCQTVGFFVNETEETYTVALSRATNKDFRPFADLLSIPKKAIKRIKAIEIRRK